MTPRLVRRSLWLLGFGCLWLPVFDDPPLQTGAYVQDVTRTGAVVAIVTADAMPMHLSVADAEGRPVAAAENLVPIRRHNLRVDGLSPGTAYSFVLRDGSGDERDRGSFRTAPTDDRARFGFVTLGDSGAMPWWVWLQRSPLWYLPAKNGWLPPHGRVRQMAEQILAAQPEFVLHLGDVIYPWGWSAHYGPGFFQPFAESLRRTPWYGVLGNHDVMDSDGRQMLHNFVLPENGLSGDERMYSLVWGSLRIVVFDATEVPMAADHPSIAFLRRELAAATEPWLLAASHFPIQSASRQGDRQDLLDHVMPLLRQYEVDLYLCGHDHTYQRLGVEGGVPQIVSGGGGKSLYELREHPAARVAMSEYHHCEVEVGGNALTVRAIGLDGRLLDTLLLEKAAESAARVRGANPARAARIEALLE